MGTGDTEALYQELSNAREKAVGFYQHVVSGGSGYICGCGTWVEDGKTHVCGGIDQQQLGGTAGYVCIFCKEFVGWGQDHTCLFESFDADVKMNQIHAMLHKICAKLNIEVE